MRAGTLRHLVRIQQKREAETNSYGEQVDEWATVAEVYAAVEPISGKEFFARDQRQAEVTTRIRIRARCCVLPTMRVLFDTRIYDIKAVLDQQERGREMHLMCSEGVSNG